MVHPEFGFCQTKYWKATAHSLITTKREKESNINFLFVFCKFGVICNDIVEDHR
jgi:hypothetical protein